MSVIVWKCCAWFAALGLAAVGLASLGLLAWLSYNLPHVFDAAASVAIVLVFWIRHWERAW